MTTTWRFFLVVLISGLSGAAIDNYFKSGWVAIAMIGTSVVFYSYYEQQRQKKKKKEETEE